MTCAKTPTTIVYLFYSIASHLANAFRSSHGLCISWPSLRGVSDSCLLIPLVWSPNIHARHLGFGQPAGRGLALIDQHDLVRVSAGQHRRRMGRQQNRRSKDAQ